MSKLGSIEAIRPALTDARLMTRLLMGEMQRLIVLWKHRHHHQHQVVELGRCVRGLS